MQNLPPLPPNHREVIEAARTGSAGGGTGTIGSMGPPPLPASAFRNPAFRPRTPTGGRPISPASGRGTPTPKPIKLGSTYGTASEVHSPTRLTHRSRQSSVTSFASEIDTRFNLHGDMGGQNFGTTTDPRMIQAITQTMIGEYLWKYTRKTGRGDMSENRHRRYFWVHPYTRTLYWSDRDPASGGRAAELRAKSVQIEAVRVVTDDNPMPPGLHRKSLIVIAPGRSVKFTCTTGQRHETWFNALSYLLLRTNGNEDSGAADAGAAEDEAATGGITRDDVDEFNPTWGRRGRSNGAKSHPPVSLNSYGSRVAAASTTRADSPAVGNSMNFSMQFPTLTPTPHRNAANSSTASTPVGRQTLTTRISGYWKGGVSSTFSSLRSRSRSRVGRASLYDNSEAHDSAEEVRLMIEQQDREAARLENVRACCDGK